MAVAHGCGCAVAKSVLAFGNSMVSITTFHTKWIKGSSAWRRVKHARQRHTGPRGAICRLTTIFHCSSRRDGWTRLDCIITKTGIIRQTAVIYPRVSLLGLSNLWSIRWCDRYSIGIRCREALSFFFIGKIYRILLGSTVCEVVDVRKIGKTGGALGDISLLPPLEESTKEEQQNPNASSRR